MDAENMPPENNLDRQPNLETQLSNWTREVKEKMRSGEVFGAVHARTNFKIVTDDEGSQTLQKRDGNSEGYNGEVMLRGVDKEQSDGLYGSLMSYNNATGVREENLDENALYVSATNLDEIKARTPSLTQNDRDNKLRPIVGNQTILEFRYKQLKADSSNRPSTKWVYLALPDNLASQMQGFIEKGADPNIIREELADIFTTAETREFFDATLVDVKDGKPEIKKPIDRPPFAKTVLTTKDGVKNIDPVLFGAETVVDQPLPSVEIPAEEAVFEIGKGGFSFDDDEEDDFKFDDDDGFDFGDEDEFDKMGAGGNLPPTSNSSSGGEPPEPPRPPELPKDAEPDPKFDFSGLDFHELDYFIKREDTSAPELKALIGERSKRLADNKKLLSPLRLRIKDVLAKEGNTLSSRDKVLEIAENLENRARTGDPNYNEKDQGIIKAAGMGLVDWLDYLDAQIPGKADAGTLDDLQNKQSRTHFLRDVIKPDEIGSEISQQAQTALGGNADFAALAAAQMETAAATRSFAEGQERIYLLQSESYNQYIRQEAIRAQLDPYEFERRQPGWYRELDSNEIKNERMQRVITFRNRLSFNARVKQEQGPNNLEVSTHPQTMEWPTEAWDDMWMEMPGHRVAFVSMFRENFQLRRDGFIELSEQGRDNLNDFNRYKHERVASLAKIIKNSPEEMAAGGWADKLRVEPRKDSGEAKTSEEIQEEKAKLLATAAVATVVNMLFVGGAAESAMHDRKINDQTVVSEQFRAFMHPLRKALDKTFVPPFTAEDWGNELGLFYLQGVQYADGFKDLYDMDNLENSRGPKYFPPRLYCSIFEIAAFKKGGHAGETFARALLNTNGGGLVNLGEGFVDFANTESLRPADLGEGSQYNLWGAQYADVMDSVTKVFAVISGRAKEAKITRSGLANALAKARKQNEQFENIFTEEDLLMACVSGLTTLYVDPRDQENGGPMPGSYRNGGREFLINTPLDTYDIVVDMATKEPQLFINRDGRDIRKNILARLHAEDESVFSLSAIARSWIGSKGLPKTTVRAEMRNKAIQNQNKMRRQEHFKLE